MDHPGAHFSGCNLLVDKLELLACFILCACKVWYARRCVMRADIIGQTAVSRFKHTWRPEVDHDVVVLLDDAVEVIRV